MDKIQVFSRSEYKNDWLPQEAELLLDQMDKQLGLQVYLATQDNARLSTLLGFDLCNGELFLDTIQYSSYYELKAMCELDPTVKVVIELKQGAYIMEGKIAELQNRGRTYCVSVLIQRAIFSSCKRVQERVYFEKNYRPKVQLCPPWEPAVNGELVNLSPIACQIYLPGQDVRPKIKNRQAQFKVKFNDQFEMDCTSDVLQSKFLRQPCCHNILRLKFYGLNPPQQEQIKTFVHTLLQQSKLENESWVA